MRLRQTISGLITALCVTVALPAAASLNQAAPQPAGLPDWIAIAAPEVMQDFEPNLPPQVEHVLMLRLDVEAELAIEATVNALLNDHPADAQGQASGLLADIGAAAFVTAIWLVFFAAAFLAYRRWRMRPSAGIGR